MQQTQKISNLLTHSQSQRLFDKDKRITARKIQPNQGKQAIQSTRYQSNSQYESPDPSYKAAANKLMLANFLAQKSGRLSQIKSLMGRNQTPRGVNTQSRIFERERSSQLSNDNTSLVGNTDIQSTKRKKSLLFKEGRQSNASLDVSLSHIPQRHVNLSSQRGYRHAATIAPNSPHLKQSLVTIQKSRGADLLHRNASL